MVSILKEEAVREFLNVPERLDMADWLVGNGFCDVDPATDELIAKALWFAKEKHPDATLVDICSFATVVSGLTTGWWGGFGTDLYEKERIAVNAAVALAGGVPPNAESLVGWLPVEQATSMLTKTILSFLEEFYFCSSANALLRVMTGMSQKERELFALAISVSSDSFERVTRMIDCGQLTIDGVLDAVGFPLKKLTAREFLEWAGWAGDLEEGLSILGKYLGKGTQYFKSFPDVYVVDEDGVPLQVHNDEPSTFQEYARRCSEI